jgi:hypothetical protein
MDTHRVMNAKEILPFCMKASFDVQARPPKKSKRPSYQDALFYTFFMRLQENNLKVLGFHTFQELQEKTRIAEAMGGLKFKHKEDILNNLVYEPKISFLTLNQLCAYYKVSLVLILEKTCLRFLYSDKPEEPLWYMNQKYETLPDQDISQLLHVNLEKPLHSIHYYKLQDLVDMSLLLGLNVEKKKAPLYEHIKDYLKRIYKIE